MPTFGTFQSFSKFLDSYEASVQAEETAAEAGLSLAARRDRRRRQPQRNVAEVTATIHVHEPNDTDGDQHLRFRIRLTDIIENPPAVDADIQRCLNDHEDVFVAIRIGDRMGILNPPTSGIDAGDTLHLRGEWIPRDRAQAHGGEAMSVLHFTHHPIGFFCIETPQEQCFS